MYNLTTGDIRRILQSGDPKKIARIPKEDLQLFRENEEQREFISPEGIIGLYANICENAVKDYKREHQRRLFPRYPDKIPAKTRYEEELERFFDSDLFLNISGCMSGADAIAKIEATMIAERKKKYELAKV